MMRRRMYDIAVCLALAAAAAALVCKSAEAVSAAKDALTLCAGVIVPSLFPFFVLSSLVTELGFAARLGRAAAPVTERLFGLPGACAAPFILGLIGGYPVGAKSAAELYLRGGCTKQQAQRLLFFCNNSGPAFILGAAGASVFSSAGAGFLLYGVHAAAAVATGLIFRPRRSTLPAEAETAPAAERKSFPAAFTASVTGAAQALIGVCGFVVFFAVMLAMLRLSGAAAFISGRLAALLPFLPLSAEDYEGLLFGFTELSTGIWSLRAAGAPLRVRLAEAAFMLGWSGLSVHFQAAAFLTGAGLSLRSCILGKTVHALISVALISALFIVFPFAFV